MIKRLTREATIRQAVAAIDSQIAIVQDLLDGAIERDRPYRHLQQLRGVLEGLEMARGVVPTAHLSHEEAGV